MPQTIFLAGKVVTEDGTPPPNNTVIELICGGSRSPQGYINNRGTFSFQVGAKNGVVADASYSAATSMTTEQTNRFIGTGFGTVLQGCELMANAAGYRSTAINLSGRRLFDSPEVGTLVLSRAHQVDGVTVSVTSLKAPKDAKRAFEKGSELAAKKKFAEAERELTKAVTQYPQYAQAWYELGLLHQTQNNISGARTAYEQALLSDDKFVRPYMQMALIAAQDSKWEDVILNTDKLVKLNPYEFPEAFYFNAVANMNLKNYDKAQESARNAVKIDTKRQYPRALYLLGVLQYAANDFRSAVDSIRGYLKLVPAGTDVDVVKSRLADAERRMDDALVNN
jgi:tetratricopeptide (TPR) repeat protein